MNALSSVDMGEVTRLTRAGRLIEATALLQAGLGGRRSTSPFEPVAERQFDFERSDVGDGVWQMTGSARRKPVRDGDRQPTFDFGQKPGPRHLELVPPSSRVALFETHSVVNAAGALDYKLFVPSGCRDGLAPLVVMLHGCTQNPDDFAAGTRMNEFAERHGFLVAYPAQTKAANVSKCWNWFKDSEQRRDRGEPSLVADATRQVLARHPVDPKRVFVAGLSAGGAAAAILGCTYPDMFAGIGVHSGLACGAASDLPSALRAMRGGGGRRARPTSGVPTIVFHGKADRTVGPSNADEVLDQIVIESGPATVERGTTAAGMRYVRTIRRDADGRAVSEQWMVEGAGHAWFGGDLKGSYTDPRGPDASREMLRFFGILPDLATTISSARAAD